jgi:Kef-type K+ transport system membrane component KefB
VTPAFRRALQIATYGMLLGLAIGGFFAIRAIGVDLSAPLPTERAADGAGGKADVLPRVLLALVVILLVSRALGWAFKFLKQPSVIGEIVAGVLLGPSLLGRVAPDVAHYVLPEAIAPSLKIVAQVGVVLFMFIVGLELDTSVLRKRSHVTVGISHASIVFPFLLGCVAALLLYPRVGTRDVSFGVFALFLGASMAVTAFPVLARILGEAGLTRSHVGVIALSAAAIDDVTAWCLLAFVVAVAQHAAGSALLTIGATAAYAAIVIGAVRPLVLRAARKLELAPAISKGAVTAMFAALLVSSLVTEWIGIHALFGAFLLGAIVPHDSRLAKELIGKLEDVVSILFLPAYFAFSGMRTEIGLLREGTDWLLTGLLIVLACVGKVGGSYAAGRVFGLDRRTSFVVGVLMNTRGLMALIVLNVGRDLGVLSPPLFTMLVLVALMTTFATAPIVAWTRKEAPADLGEPFSAARGS